MCGKGEDDLCDDDPWTGSPVRYKPDEPFVARIKVGTASGDDQPEIGDLVRVVGRKGAEWIAPILAIRARTHASTYAYVGDPPWVQGAK